MKFRQCVATISSVFLLFTASHVLAADSFTLEGSWRVSSYVKGDTQVRYYPEGYMIFGTKHWLHVMFMNRDERPQDFAESHHGTYKITGPQTVDLEVDMELHMDPKKEFQDEQIWYGDPASLAGAIYTVEGDQVVIDFPSTSQMVLQRLD
jgi:hypothetical protein